MRIIQLLVVVMMLVSLPRALAEGLCFRVAPLPDGGRVDATITSQSGIDYRCDSELTNGELVARRQAQAKAAAEYERFKQRTGRATALCRSACGGSASNGFDSTSASCTCGRRALSAADCSSFCAASELPFESLGPSAGSQLTNSCVCAAHK